MDTNQYPQRGESEQRMTWRTLLCLAALGFSLGNGAAPLAAEPGGPPPPLSSMMKLTPPQQQKLSDMENTSHQQASQLTDQIRRLRERLSVLYGTYSLDTGEARQLNQQINRVQGQLLELRLTEQRQLRNILSPDQFAQLQAAIRQHGGPGDDGPPPDHGRPMRHQHDGPGHAHWPMPDRKGF